MRIGAAKQTSWRARSKCPQKPAGASVSDTYWALVRAARGFAGGLASIDMDFCASFDHQLF